MIAEAKYSTRQIVETGLSGRGDEYLIRSSFLNSEFLKRNSAAEIGSDYI